MLYVIADSKDCWVVYSIPLNKILGNLGFFFFFLIRKCINKEMSKRRPKRYKKRYSPPNKKTLKSKYKTPIESISAHPIYKV